MDAFNAADFNMTLSVMGKNRTVQHSHNLKYELSFAQKESSVSFWVIITGNNKKELTILSCSLPDVNSYPNSSALSWQAATKWFLPKAQVVTGHMEGL